MDRYHEASKNYHSKGDYATIDAMSLAIERTAQAFRWYDERREKETCETPSHIGYHKSWWKFCPVCGRRIVEKERISA